MTYFRLCRLMSHVRSCTVKTATDSEGTVATFGLGTKEKNSFSSGMSPFHQWPQCLVLLFLLLQLLTQWAHPKSPSTDQQDNPIRHKGLLPQALINQYGTLCLSDGEGGATKSKRSCLGSVCHVVT